MGVLSQATADNPVRQAAQCQGRLMAAVHKSLVWEYLAIQAQSEQPQKMRGMHKNFACRGYYLH